MGRSLRGDERGVSKVVGVTLLIALSVTGALVVLAAGQDTIGQTTGQQNDQMAEDTFREADTMFATFAHDENKTGERAVEVPSELRSDLALENDTTYRIRLDGNPECDSGEHQLGTMIYDRGERTVGYEGGGIWERSESGASMRSPPEVTYENGGLDLQFPNVSGQMTRSDAITAQSNASLDADRDRAMSLALYTNLSYGETGEFRTVCEPASVANATVWINQSRFAPAWARYAERNYDDRRVEVEPSSGVTEGDNVSMTFVLGDVSEPVFNVTEAEITRGSSGDPLWYNATVRNEGGLDATESVTFDFADSSGTTVASDSESVSLDGGNETRVNFSVSASTLSGLSAGDYTATVSTPNDTRATTIALSSSSGTGNFEVDGSAAGEANPGDDEELTVTVENTGGMTERQRIVYEFNGTDWDSETVQLNPSDTTTVTFDLPTHWSGDHTWTVRSEDDTDSDSFLVGRAPYFEVTSTNTASDVAVADTYELEATVENTGELDGTQTVELRIRNESTGTVVASSDPTLSLAGTHTGPGSSTESLSWSPSDGDQGTWEWVVRTENDTRTGTFTVGDAENPNFVIESIEPSEDPGPQGRQVYFNVTVTNVGSETDTQRVVLETESDQELLNATRTLNPGITASVNESVYLSESEYPTGDYTLNATTDNSTVTQPYRIEDPENINSSDGEIVVEERVRAEVTALGAELEGRGYDDYRETYYVTNSPTVMSLWIENSSGTYVDDLWTDTNRGNVNHPRSERAIIDSIENDSVSNPFNETFVLESGSSVSLYSRSYYCDSRAYTDVVWEDLIQFDSHSEDAVGVECTDWNGIWINITDSQNSDNVVILEDGEQIPGNIEAPDYQRDVNQILRSRIGDDGRLDLESGERVFMYELSERNAHPSEAGDNEDPDYNDAVALFRVVEVQETANAPASFEITDVDAPTRVERSNTAPVDVTVENTGGQTDSTRVQFTFAGDTYDQSVGDLEPGESQTVTFYPDTDHPPDNYEYTAEVTDEENEARSGQMYIGSPPPGPRFLITDVEAPSAVHVDEPATAEVTIANTGGSGDTQTVYLNATSGTMVDRETGVTVASGHSETVTLELRNGSVGTFDYRIATDDVTSGPHTLFVGESDVSIRSLDVSTESYGNDTLVERRTLDNMQFELANSGTMGDEREASLTVTNLSDGSTEYANTTTVQVGEGRLSSDFPAWVSEDVDLSPGYYEYEFVVRDDGTVEDRWVGELFVSDDVALDGADNSTSPVTVDSDEITVGD